ncbi:hypothetical protein ACH9L7_03540 [Haloferax sp. S1W]|uniref:hypothetical protein n=1 Tax=Haloferax sp. S1W TaxID=3377110 RepID=UPI0037C6064B
MPQLTRRSLLRTLGVSGAVAAGAGLGSAHPEHSEVRKQLAAVRRATSKYHDVQTAIDDGYVPEEHCVSNPAGDGAMGFHYPNFELFFEPGVDLENPEVLVYEKRGENLHLVAVEYAAQESFTLFGQDAHPPNEVPFYTLHAWVWKANPNGVFAGFNPNVRCPSE